MLAGMMESLSPVQVYYTGKCHPTESQSKFVAILMGCYDKNIKQ